MKKRTLYSVLFCDLSGPDHRRGTEEGRPAGSNTGSEDAVDDEGARTGAFPEWGSWSLRPDMRPIPAHMFQDLSQDQRPAG